MKTNFGEYVYMNLSKNEKKDSPILDDIV